MTGKITLLVVLLVISGCAGELVLDREGALTVIPLQVSDAGKIVVDTMLNGSGPFEFALDTGASISVVYDRPGTRAPIGPLGNETVHVLGISGSGTFPIANVAGITVGSETWEDARVALLPEIKPDLARIDGILGVDFLRRYAVWYSNREREIRLYPRELVAQRDYRGWSSIPLFDSQVGDGDASILAFNMLIDAQRIPTLFDLGSSENLMNRQAANLLDVPSRASRDVAKVLGVTGKTTIVIELIVWQLQIENMKWRNRSFLIGDFPLFEALGVSDEPVAIVGTDLFQQRDFIIDFARRRLLVRRAAPIG
jgi:hypothetical protein